MTAVLMQFYNPDQAIVRLERYDRAVEIAPRCWTAGSRWSSLR